MDAAFDDPMSQDRQIAAAVRRERPRLLAFIRRRIEDAAEAEDILQDALYELVAVTRLEEPVEAFHQNAPQGIGNIGGRRAVEQRIESGFGGHPIGQLRILT